MAGWEAEREWGVDGGRGGHSLGQRGVWVLVGVSSGSMEQSGASWGKKGSQGQGRRRRGVLEVWRYIGYFVYY